MLRLPTSCLLMVQLPTVSYSVYRVHYRNVQHKQFLLPEVAIDALAVTMFRSLEFGL
jgi:hypothetical protein